MNPRRPSPHESLYVASSHTVSSRPASPKAADPPGREIDGTDAVESVLEAIRRVATTTPDRLAARSGTPAIEITYGELESLSNRLARHLEASGVEPGSIVGLCASRSIRLLVGMLAVLKARAAYLPLDPSYPAGRIEFMVRDAMPATVLTERPILEAFGFDDVPPILLEDLDSIVAAVSDEPLPESAGSDELAYIMYTSGSTGDPKGVEIARGGLANVFASVAERMELGADDRMLAVSTLSGDISTLELLLPLTLGALVEIADDSEVLNPATLVRTMERVQPTVMQTTPTLWNLLLDAGWQGTPDLQVMSGGEAIDSVFAERLVRRSRRAWNLYGPTEVTIWTSMTPMRGDGWRPTLGEPIRGLEMLVLDDEGGLVEGEGIGELHVGGIGLARGYRNRPDLTARAFIEPPAGLRCESTRLYRTGDLVRRLPTGELEFAGRVDHQVKVRGVRVELGEIESTLMRDPRVSAAAVVPRVDPRGVQRLAAYLAVDSHRSRELPGAAGDETRLARERIEMWQAVFDQILGESAAEDPADDLRTWRSSVDHQPIPRREMSLWIDETLDRCLELAPESVLEIGCRNGILLARLAPRCRRYLATEGSRVALERARQVAAELAPGRGSCRVMRRRLDQIDSARSDALVDRPVDLAILHSVAAYCPSLDVLSALIAGAAACVRPGGTVYLADVRDLRLLEAFHVWTELQRAGPVTTRGVLSERVRKALDDDRQLAVHPRFFETIPESLSDVTGVRLRSRRRGPGELTLFRYDVLLRVGRSVEDSGQSADSEPAADAPPRLEPAPGAARALAALRVLDESDPQQSIAELKRLVDRPDAPSEERLLDDREGERDDERLSNDPLSAARARVLVRDLKRELADRLPVQMMPSSFVLLPELPLTPNLKIDRKALGHEDRFVPYSRLGATAELVAPSTATEAAIVRLCVELLRVPEIGVEDEFFELGGDSLLAVQLLARLRTMFGVELSFVTLVDAGSLRQLAEQVDRAVEERRPMADDPVDEPAFDLDERRRQLIREVAALSDEEVREQLRRERSLVADPEGEVS